MRNAVIASILLATTLTTACTPTQKKVGAATLAAGSLGLAGAGVGSFVEGKRCENDPEDDCDTYGLMYGLGGMALAGAAVLAAGAGLLYYSAKKDEREAEAAPAPAPAPVAHATLGGFPVVTE